MLHNAPKRAAPECQDSKYTALSAVTFSHSSFSAVCVKSETSIQGTLGSWLRAEFITVWNTPTATVPLHRHGHQAEASECGLNRSISAICWSLFWRFNSIVMEGSSAHPRLFMLCGSQIITIHDKSVHRTVIHVSLPLGSPASAWRTLPELR